MNLHKQNQKWLVLEDRMDHDYPFVQARKDFLTGLKQDLLVTIVHIQSLSDLHLFCSPKFVLIDPKKTNENIPNC